MKKKLRLRLSASGIDAAIRELSAYQKWVEEKSRQLTERLAMIGAHEASVRFAGAIYDGENDASVTVEPTAHGYRIVASGQSVAFIEFGTGVYHNGNEPYPSPPSRPDGVSPIGEYGQGKGKRQGWVYNDGGEARFTRGNPAAMPLYYASREMERQVAQIAQEVFS